MKKKLWKTLRWLHKWPSLVLSIFFILWPLSGIVLNHRETFSSLDVDRNNLPSEYLYNNWNNASIRGSLQYSPDSLFLYGDVGIWLHKESENSFHSFNNGFSDGVDNRKITCLINHNKKLYAGGRTGLYSWNIRSREWKEITLPDNHEKVVDLIGKDGHIYCMTRSHIYKLDPLKTDKVEILNVLPAEGENIGNTLFKTLWVIHSGEIYGLPGKLIVDFVGLAFIFLTITGWIYFLFPRIIKRRKKHEKKSTRLIKISRFSIKWHNKLGIWIVALMIITTLTGMFLRPPLLILIAKASVGKIPFTVLDRVNPWYDRFRALEWDEERDQFLIGTVDGIYFVDEKFSSKPVKPHIQPPISVMGINVFDKLDNGFYRVGSFSGLFAWSPDKRLVLDYFTGRPIELRSGPAMPISNHMVSGFHIDRNGKQYYFDYNQGAVSIRHEDSFIDMPAEIMNTPMSLWNLALEMHTARLLKVIIGPFYLLFIPLFGLFTLIILISGILLWLKKFKSKRRGTGNGRREGDHDPHLS